MGTSWLRAAALIAPCLLAEPALAQDPAPHDVRDLIGARASSGEQALQSRGYALKKVQKGEDRVWANWWNARSKVCLTVVTRDGRYDSIVSGPSFDCQDDRRPPQAGGDRDDGERWFDTYKGERPTAAESALEKRGFRNVKGHKEGHRSMTWWQKDNKQRCIKMTVENGRVADIDLDRGGC